MNNSRVKEWHQNHPERRKEHRRRWILLNPEKVKESRRRWRSNNPEKVREAGRRHSLKRRRLPLTAEQKWRYQLKAKYGITASEYFALLDKQGKVCAVCKDEKATNTGKRFHVDHNHKTNEIRGLLCSRCNLALGLLRDNLQIIKALVHYVEKNSTI